MNTTRDRSGQVVSEGDTVRVLSIDAALIGSLDPDDKTKVASMVGLCLRVSEVNEVGHAVVEQWWRDGPDASVSHSIGLAPDEIERVEPSNRQREGSGS